MITRLLESFNALDTYSKTVLERHAKKSCQQSMPRHCFAYDKGNKVPVLHLLSSRTSIYEPKSSTVIEEQDRLSKRLRISKSSGPVTSMKGTSSIRSVELISTKIDILPFTSNESSGWTSPTNVKPSDGSFMCQDKEEEAVGFMIASLKKPQCLRPYRRSPHRIKWSREVENVSSLYALNKDTSKALMGSSLGYTDTSHWRSNSYDSVDGPFKLPGPVGILELNQGNDAKFGISMPHKVYVHSVKESPKRNCYDFENVKVHFSHLTFHSCAGEKFQEQLPPFKEEVLVEPVPLSLEDELERKNVKVLTPCHTSVYKALPIVSETYPVVYSSPQHQHKPFSSPGFHSLDSPEPLTQIAAVRKSKVHSAIVHITESIQTDYMMRRLRERQTAEALQCSRSCSESGLKVPRMGAYHVNLHLLSADGHVVKSPDLRRLPLQSHLDVSLSVPTNKRPQILPVMPRRMGHSATCAGSVVNGQNSDQTTDTGGRPSTYSKLLHESPRRRFSSRCYISAPQTQQSKGSNPKNKQDFLLISKPVTYRQNSVKGIIINRKTHTADWSKEATVVCEDFMSQGTDSETFEENGMSCSTPTRQADPRVHATGSPVAEVTGCNGTEDTSRFSYFLHLPQPINIPTAETLN
ncbi:hypothetical protein NFI96_011195 [Prochilodus magdalenae]|nr:hypothetical protein NFI96_011195 [Prochilodus magdalenae]